VYVWVRVCVRVRVFVSVRLCGALPNLVEGVWGQLRAHVLSSACLLTPLCAAASSPVLCLCLACQLLHNWLCCCGLTEEPYERRLQRKRKGHEPRDDKEKGVKEEKKGKGEEKRQQRERQEKSGQMGRDDKRTSNRRQKGRQIARARAGEREREREKKREKERGRRDRNAATCTASRPPSSSLTTRRQR
jgi:hypothetical protein